MSSVEFTSEAVRGAKFREKLKGYHPEDVDAFLERAATALDQMSARLAEATARAMKAETALASNSEADESVRKTLVLAQRTADMAVNEANEEARQIREAAEADAQATRAAAIAEAGELQTKAEQARNEATAEAEAMRAAAATDAEARLREAAEHIEAEDQAARAAREERAAEAVRASEEAVRSLAEQQHQLRAEVEDLARYLAAERARILEVLTTAVDRFGEALAPTGGAGAEDIEVAIDREELAKGSPDPAAEDSWSFDPTVLEQPENQWWSEAEGTAPTDAEAHTEGPETAPGAGDAEAGPAPAGADWAAGLDSNEPLPEWFTTAVGPASEGTTEPETAAATEAGAETDTAPEAVDGAPAQPEPVAAEGDRESADDDEEPSTLLFTLEDEGGRHSHDDDLPFSAEAKQRKTLLGRRRD